MQRNSKERNFVLLNINSLLGMLGGAETADSIRWRIARDGMHIAAAESSWHLFTLSST